MGKCMKFSVLIQKYPEEKMLWALGLSVLPILALMIYNSRIMANSY